MPSGPAARWLHWEPRQTLTARVGRVWTAVVSQSRCDPRRTSREHVRGPPCGAGGCMQPPPARQLADQPHSAPLPAVGGSCLWGSVIVLPVNSQWSCPATCTERGHTAIVAQAVGRALCRKRMASGQTFLGGLGRAAVHCSAGCQADSCILLTAAHCWRRAACTFSMATRPPHPPFLLACRHMGAAEWALRVCRRQPCLLPHGSWRAL